MNSIHKSLPELGWSNFYQTQLDADEIGTQSPLRVTEVHRNAIEVLGENGPDRLPMIPVLVDHGVAVGDWILQDRESDRATRVLDRKSELKRKSAGSDMSSQLIAANIDTLFIVSSCNADFNVARIERYLALAHQSDVEPVLLLTKADLCDDPYVYIDKARAAFPSLVVETIDATKPEAADVLEPWCGHGATVVLVGSSGVGKTTITNTVTGNEIFTQEIREDDAKGRHTTTRRSMYPTVAGGWLIDTPGIRELQLYDVREGVEMVFEDITELVTQCRFNDCAHETEPGCAVQAAIADGTLDEARLVRWGKLMREDARNSESLQQSNSRSKRLNKVMKGGQARAKAKRSGRGGYE